jgi:transcriptional regulator with XRE-family HTH domain/tetratricopeptide (TPR) repeat protein
MAFGPLLRRLRLDADLTLEQLAARSGVSDRAISDMERGVSHGPQARTVAAITEALRLGPESRAALAAAARAGRQRRRPGGRSDGDTADHPRDGRADLTAPTGNGSAPVTLPPVPVPAQLPADLAVFSGRRDEVAELVDRLTPAAVARAPLVGVITGMAGIGKTTMAVHCAHRVAVRCPDGQLYANLRGFDQAGAARVEDVLRGFLDALGVPSRQVPDGLEAQAALYRSRVAGRRLLVLLDNARDSEQVRPLLPGSAGNLVIVTSRSQLSGLVATHGAHPVPLDLPTHDEAREVLARRLGTARVAGENAAVDEIVQRCARLPLALAIVAARAATNRRFPLAAIADELRTEGGLTAFKGPEAAVDARAVFSWSYAALSPAAARLFRLVALHPSLPADVRVVASLAGAPVEEVRPLLAELTDAHLVTETTPGRYVFHDLLRAYAAELCLTGGSAADRHAARRRMVEHYLRSAYAADRLISPTRSPISLPEPVPGVVARRFADEAAAVAWFTVQRPALLAAVEAAYADGFDDPAWQLAWCLEQYLERWGHWADWAVVGRVAMRAARRLDDPYALAQAHRGLGLLTLLNGAGEDPVPHLVEALALFERVGDVDGQALARRALSLAHEQQGKPELALHHAEVVLDLYRSTGNRGGEGLALNMIALFRTRLGGHDAAVPVVERAITLLAEVGHRRGEAAAWDTLGSVRQALAQPGPAVEAYRRAAQLRAQVGDRYQQAQTLVRLGRVHAGTGERDAARSSWHAALALLTEMRHPDTAAVNDLLATLT